jgi:hypothetical protein
MLAGEQATWAAKQNKKLAEDDSNGRELWHMRVRERKMVITLINKENLESLSTP